MYHGIYDTPASLGSGQRRCADNGFNFGSNTQAGAYSSPFFLVSLLICRMYPLYQAAIIWVLPVFSTIEKSRKKGELSDLTFFVLQKVEPFFLTFFVFLVPLPVYEFL